MKAIRLIAKADEYDNKPGLVIKGMPDFDGLMADRDGSSIAHDLLEHQNGLDDMGPVWDELEALGGIWQVRGRHGDLQTTTGHAWTPAQNVGHDIGRMFLDWDGDNGPHSMATRPHDYDEDFNEIISFGLEQARQEWPHARDEEELDESQLDAFGVLALHRMRTGFRKAQRRFGDGFCGYEMFRAVKEAVSRVCGDVEYEGQEFILSYGDCTATIREVMDDYY